MIRGLVLACACVCACGSPELVAPAPLLVVDTSPGNGSLILPGEAPIAILFSEDVVLDRIEGAVRLEETTAEGVPIQDLALALDSYDSNTFTAVLRTDPLPPATIYALTVSAAQIRATSGARMLNDLVHRFRTGE